MTHTWDPAGNRVLKIDGGARTTATYDMANQLRYQQDSTGRTTFAFDGAGNMVLQSSATGGRTTQVWDGQNRLLQTLLPGATRNTYAYDGDGRRVLREDSTGSASLIWDGQNVLQEVATGGGLLAQYTNGTAGYGPLLSKRRSGASVFHLFDGLGSTNRLTDVYGNVLDQYIYDAFGEIRSSQGSSINPYRFIGQLGYGFDPDTVQYYLRARYYRPDLARFLSADPLGNAGEDLYWYALNNPLVWFDPSGLTTAGHLLRFVISFVPEVPPLLPLLIPVVVIGAAGYGLYRAGRWVYRGVKEYRRALKEAQKELKEAQAEGRRLDAELLPKQVKLKKIEEACLKERRKKEKKKRCPPPRADALLVSDLITIFAEFDPIAQMRRTVAVSSICLKSNMQRQLVYAVSGNDYTRAVVMAATQLQYMQIPDAFAVVNQTDAEQIILNYAEMFAILRPDVKTPIAPSRVPCGLLRLNGLPAQNCDARIATTPGVYVVHQGYMFIQEVFKITE